MNMAFLSSFRAGRETVFPQELRERLRGFPLLEQVGEAALGRVLADPAPKPRPKLRKNPPRLVLVPTTGGSGAAAKIALWASRVAAAELTRMLTVHGGTT